MHQSLFRIARDVPFYSSITLQRSWHTICCIITESGTPELEVDLKKKGLDLSTPCCIIARARDVTTSSVSRLLLKVSRCTNPHQHMNLVCSHPFRSFELHKVSAVTNLAYYSNPSERKEE